MVFIFTLFFLVGGGSAGAVLASRLSEDSDKKILLLEAGGEESEHPFSHIPFLCGLLQNTNVDWQYRTVPQKNACLSLVEQVEYLRPCTGYYSAIHI